jgi:hypothetical protein
MMSPILTLALSASLAIGQTGGKPGKPGAKRPGGKPTATKLVKTPAMQKIEKDTGATILVNDPTDGLITVDIGGPKASDAVIAEITTFKGLHRLKVSSSSITDKSVAAIANTSSLVGLVLLKNEKLTSRCIADIAAMPNLVSLQLSQIDLDLKALKSLSSMGSLRALSLNAMGLTDADLAAFVGNTTITSLGLGVNDGIKGKGLKSLHGRKQLEFVNLVGTHASSGQIADFKEAIKKLGGAVEVQGKGGALGVTKVKPLPK